MAGKRRQASGVRLQAFERTAAAYRKEDNTPLIFLKPEA
jgi:hypothetical protein